MMLAAIVVNALSGLVKAFTSKFVVQNVFGFSSIRIF